MVPLISITPETVAEFRPSPEAGALIHEAARAASALEAYLDYRFGSAYYVELPRYVERLVSEGRTEEATEVLAQCFAEGFRMNYGRRCDETE
jgi:hypothetical protein